MNWNNEQLSTLNKHEKKHIEQRWLLGSIGQLTCAHEFVRLEQVYTGDSVKGKYIDVWKTQCWGIILIEYMRAMPPSPFTSFMYAVILSHRITFAIHSFYRFNKFIGRCLPSTLGWFGYASLPNLAPSLPWRLSRRALPFITFLTFLHHREFKGTSTPPPQI